MAIFTCGQCGQRLSVRNGKPIPCSNLACDLNRHVGVCEILKRGWELHEPTDKQLALIAKLASELQALGAGEHDTGAHCKHCASVRIENYIAGVKYYQRKQKES
jgi:hypothetical protein